MVASGVFNDAFLSALHGLVIVHHSIYPDIPPQGIYFEALVERALRDIKKPFSVIPTERNQPTHDLLVESTKLSIKTETGKGTDPNQIAITKLCTTEREPWTPEVLIGRVMEHLSRYDLILMLRAIWKDSLLHYQLLEIPVATLALIQMAKLAQVGRRKGRQSLGADVYQDGELVFRVHFDGSDGKCQIRKLHLKYCAMLREWDRPRTS
ncbi:MAG TPA: hypothetical protein VEC38_05370 [Candidatus Binataceae bacterium]|nr:hypothetical protein [Candidatus Binataceae bacterium]